MGLLRDDATSRIPTWALMRTAHCHHDAGKACDEDHPRHRGLSIHRAVTSRTDVRAVDALIGVLIGGVISIVRTIVVRHR
jgi:hypothetical protein